KGLLVRVYSLGLGNWIMPHAGPPIRFPRYRSESRVAGDRCSFSRRRNCFTRCTAGMLLEIRAGELITGVVGGDTAAQGGCNSSLVAMVAKGDILFAVLHRSGIIQKFPGTLVLSGD